MSVNAILADIEKAVGDVEPADKILHCGFTDVNIEVKASERTVVSHISTDGLDRDKEILLPKGADMKQYRKNPVVLWAHDGYSPPIGKNQWIKRTPEAIVAKTAFADTDRGNEVFDLIKGGFLNAFSVGFRPTESRQPTEEDIKENPGWKNAWRIFTKWELLEYSVVPVPANPEALITAVGKGFNLSIDLQDQMGIMVCDQAIEVTPIDFEVRAVPFDVKPVYEVTPVYDVTPETQAQIIARTIKDQLAAHCGRV